MRADFVADALLPQVLQMVLGQGTKAFLGSLADPALSALGIIAPTRRDLAEAAIHTDAKRFLKRRALVRCLLARQLGCNPADVGIGHGAFGAPQVLMIPARDAPTLYISIAARGDIFAVAFAPGPIGIDLEPLGEVMEPAWNILTTTEHARLRGMDIVAAHRAFLEIWTAREAFLKAGGRGLLVDVDQSEWQTTDFCHGWVDFGGMELALAIAQK